jgi:ribosome-binding protein aMBF1 (putative translation factor)
MMVVRRERDREVNGRIARLVSKARKKAGLTQADLAVMVGMTGVVSNWEQGVFLPPADKRTKIAHVLWPQQQSGRASGLESWAITVRQGPPPSLRPA